MRNFNEEMWVFFDKILEGENFAFSRYGDGEFSIINGHDWDAIKGDKRKNVWDFFESDKRYDVSKKLIKKSFINSKEGYFKGIPCQCCLLKEKALSIYGSIEDKSHLTWANLFVNGNYKDFNTYFASVLEGRQVFMISHHNSTPEKLPFKVEENWKIGDNAWVDDLKLLQELKDYIEIMEIENAVFLMAGGPFASIFASEMWNFNKQNTYIDIGSSLDVYLFGKATRHYQLTDNELHYKNCIWFEKEE
jgi:hypothetical protein